MLAPNPSVSILERARNLIADPAKWVQGTFETDGRICSYRAVEVAVNPDGALHSVPADEMRLPLEFLRSAAIEVGQYPYQSADCTVCNANNSLTHGGVMAMFDRAIALAKEPVN